MTLGSLFDGIGGFPLAAQMYGITPLWASEIEAAPISITKRHFPNMKHYGDVIKIDGAELPPVDIITFGSPRGGIEQWQAGYLMCRLTVSLTRNSII